MRRILEQWSALSLYFTSANFDDPTHGNELARSDLKNPFFKVLMMFVDHALGLLNDFNVLFQSKSPIFYKLRTKILKLIATLAVNYMDGTYVRNCTDLLALDVTDESHYVDVQKVYLGYTAEEELASLVSSSPDISQLEVRKVYITARDFYKEAIIQIQRHFTFECDF